MNTAEQPSIWKINAEGDKISDKVHGVIGGWQLVNCFKNKLLWRHTSGEITRLKNYLIAF